MKWVKENWKITKKSMLQSMGFFLGFAIIVGVVTFIILFSSIEFTYIGKYILNIGETSNTSPQNTTMLKNLVAEGTVISAEKLYTNILSYYNTLITILIGFSALIGVIGFFYITVKTKKEAEKMVEDAANRYFNRYDFHNTVSKKIVEVTNSWDSDYDRLTGKMEIMEENIEKLLANLPTEGDTIITEDNQNGDS